MKRFLTLIMASMCLLNVCAQQIDITSAEDFSPYVFGHNLEHTRAAVNGGLSAQMLKNRKFAGKPSRNRGVAAHWKGIGEKVLLKAGPYMSVLLDKSFEGYVYDGYLRQGDPTGPKVTMGSKEDERATYDFSDDMRSLQFGIAAGVDWQFSHRFGVSADLNWGLNGIFKKDFKTVEQTLYPIYGTIGVFYRIK